MDIWNKWANLLKGSSIFLEKFCISFECLCRILYMGQIVYNHQKFFPEFFSNPLITSKNPQRNLDAFQIDSINSLKKSKIFFPEFFSDPLITSKNPQHNLDAFQNNSINFILITVGLYQVIQK